MSQRGAAGPLPACTVYQPGSSTPSETSWISTRSALGTHPQSSMQQPQPSHCAKSSKPSMSACARAGWRVASSQQISVRLESWTTTSVPSSTVLGQRSPVSSPGTVPGISHIIVVTAGSCDPKQPERCRSAKLSQIARIAG
jgi:hypothetical protein